MSSLRTRFGAYLLTDCIGQGGMAVVYRAKREGWSGFEKTVVVKAMLPALAAHREHVDRFIAEAKIQAQLSHPGIVQVNDFGVFNGTPYLVMEHLSGVNLSQLLNALAQSRRRMPIPVALVVGTQMCHALGYAHAFRDSTGNRRQIIHSDVSPSNVMVCRDGSVKLLDFGVAKIIDAYDYDTSQTVQGKFPYMSPEQVNRLPVDRRADVFAAGIVMHEMLAGRRLFAAPTELETLRRVNACEVAPPSVYNPEVSLGLDAVVLKALSRDPADRFDSGDEMAAALMQVERIGAGRQRVAEFVAKIFPPSFAAFCEVCGKPATPGFACSECGNEIPPEAPSTQNVRVEDLLEIMDDEDLEPEIIRGDPVIAVEPYPLATIVDPRRPGPSRVRRALAVAGTVGVIASVAILRMYTPSFLREPIEPKRAPRRDESQPIRIVPTPVPVVCPPPAVSSPEPQPQEAAAVKSRDNTPTQPLPMTQHKHKMARIQLKKTPVPRTAASPKQGEVRQGALLDPFGQDE
ncbi:MAG TPA: serine/threonine-protein kinase [Polyangia bacterium]|nr:serine/threonine-protein kinase [Polyangia bacterium]